MQVSFVCQRCCQPLKLDTSFNVLDRVTVHELTGLYRNPSDVKRSCVHFCPINVSHFLSLAPLVTVTPSKQADGSEGQTAPEVGTDLF